MNESMIHLFFPIFYEFSTGRIECHIQTLAHTHNHAQNTQNSLNIAKCQSKYGILSFLDRKFKFKRENVLVVISVCVRAVSSLVKFVCP